MRVNREEWLRVLESVQAGIASREMLEQSTCFVFKGRRVYTYNDEVFCKAKSLLDKSFVGAVQAQPLLDLLRKLSEDEVEIEQTDKDLCVIGKRRRAGITMQKNIVLEVDSVDEPKQWKKMHEDFADAVAIVKECAGRDNNQFAMTCIHLAPKWIEASDRYQINRFRIRTGVDSSVLVRSQSLKSIVSLGMTEFGETDSWMHFRNDSGLQLSCRRWIEEYPDLKPYLSVTGDVTDIPKGLKEAAECAEVFSSQNADYNLIRIELTPGKLMLRGESVNGWYQESKKVSYKGEPVDFLIGPKTLSELVNKTNVCEVCDGKLKVNGGKWKYITVLGKQGGNGNGKEEDGADE